ncbi:hypothetical protein ACIPK7_16660, partial [Pseudomonas sp. NPDC086581]|uniref:hypothetical protein n=1 Tax=Pseudomonas sp. NPDC086581 TaxID=3364432 RepID=UPI0037F7D1A4
KRGFCSRMADSSVLPERGKPDMKWKFCIPAQRLNGTLQLRDAIPFEKFRTDFSHSDQDR